MAGKGPAPKKGAIRRNAAGAWSVAEWGELVDGDEVPDPPDGIWCDEALGLWADLWSGPLRAELLPQHAPMMFVLLRCMNQLHDPELSDSALLRLSAELRMLSDRFGLDPSAVRRLRVEVKRPGAGGSVDEVAKAREARLAEIRSRAASS